MDNQKNTCPQCLNRAVFLERGITEDGRDYTLYKCPTCRSVTRVFDVPQTEHEVVLKALVEEPAKVPKREERVEKQLSLWDAIQRG